VNEVIMRSREEFYGKRRFLKIGRREVIDE
jgi:hypothetical protein